MDGYKFEKTSDGLLAAKLGNMTFAFIPAGDDGYKIDRVVSEWTGKDVSGLTRKDFRGFGNAVPGEEGFKAYVADYHEHLRQAAELNRYRQPSKIRTPWGESQGVEVYAEKGIYLHSTAGHGGFKVFARLNREIPAAYRNEDGWYEEDCEYAKVIVSLPALFTDREIRLATETVRNWFPDEYEAVTGETILAGRSFKKDERLFKERHAGDWVVIAASRVDAADGTDVIHCHATKGGERGGWSDGKEIVVETAEFIVPAEEYSKRGRYGFVIDPERHERVDAPAQTPGR